MPNKIYKAVLVPVSVPRGKYCYNKSPEVRCPWFMWNPFPNCQLDVGTVKKWGKGKNFKIKKPDDCLDLKECDAR
jgi:hypothetical protein